MGFGETYKCPRCNFKYTNNHLNFFYDEEREITDEFMMLKSTCGIDRNAKIKGFIRQSYCLNCNKIVKNYQITKYPPNMSEKEVISIIKKGIENSSLKRFEEDSLFTIEIYDEYLYESIDFSEISKKREKKSLSKRIINLISLNRDYEQTPLFIECPKCNSYLNIHNTLKRYPICNKKIIRDSYLCD